MRLCDVNILVYAFRSDAPDHPGYRDWLLRSLDDPEPFGLSDLVLSGFVRIATHPRIFNPPTPVDNALKFVDMLRSAHNVVPVAPGARHWGIFVDLCRGCNAKGNLVPDAYLAALALENGCEWFTADRGFARFRKLRWRHPLDG